MRISELARIIGSIHLQQPDYTLFLLPSCATNGVHLWFVKYHGVSISDLNINGVSLPAGEDYGLVQWIVAVPIMLGHAINWYGDKLAYQRWNISDKVTSKAGFGSDTGLVSRLDSVLAIVREKTGSESEQHIAVTRLEEIRSDVIRLNTFSGWYIYLWNLAAPLGCSLTALFWHT